MPAPLVLGPSTSATGIRRDRYRRLLAEQLGTWQRTTVTTTASAHDPGRVVLANELRDDEAGYPLLGTWLWARTADTTGAQRRILSQPDAGYQGAQAGVVLSRPFTSALPAGTPIEVTSPLPVDDHLGVRGLNTIINEALSRIRIAARVVFTGNGGYEYDLSTLAPLTDRGQILGIHNTWEGSTYPSTLSIHGYDIIRDGASATLRTDMTYAADGTFEVSFAVKADRYVSDGAAWAFPTTPGLQNDAYQAAAPEHWVVAFGMVRALRHLEEVVDNDPRLGEAQRERAIARIAGKRRQWARTARDIMAHEFPKGPAERTGLIVRATTDYGTGGWIDY